MSSSMRNAVQRRQHRERAQPLERAKYGLLEKHKDYSLRAADHKKKQATLKNLRAKAADKNEDEFYFGMMSRGARGPVRGAISSKGRKWDGIVDGDRGSLKGMDVEVSRLLKTQDLGYLRTMRNVASKEVKVLEERVVALVGSLEGLGVKAAGGVDGESEDEFAGLDDDDDLDERPRKKKYVFSEAVEDRDDMVMQVDGNDEDMDDEDDNSLGENDDRIESRQAHSKKPKRQTQHAPTKEEAEKLRAEQKQVLLGKLERRLESARRKVAVLARAENKLELQRAKMAKTATATGGVNKAGRKIKIRERKR
ncbi:small-subunit processome [Microdochium trichocladiopsis]|uniref:Small-subunit processome n=1 Tax=Microdochium trichocladiopsis TaxID=1682393 RepID=A0A9P8Y4D9_9PEZI|nr:small-subunit processome [Microdochium trichocladiopsis]KAH7027395.1 small-subunit processome [Microdochium trichocladiopsis]